jgi:glycosyltransferase involved in cell wall biosynthesis
MTLHTNPLISVVMPVFKGLDYISSSINSILNQSYNNLELIVIDDNDNDYCLSILSNYNDSRIRFFKGKRRGLPAARNYGLELANGAYIANMDADDISRPDRLSTQLDFLISKNVDICGSWIKLFGKFNHRIIRFPLNDVDIKYAMLSYSPIANPTVLIKSSIIKNFRYRNTVAEDYDLWVRLAKSNYSFANIQKPLLFYRMHDEQTSVTKYGQMVSDTLPIIIDYSKFYLSDLEYSKYESLSFGSDSIVRLQDSIKMGNFLVDISNNRSVDKDIVCSIIAKFFNKTKPINIKVFLAYFKIVHLNNFSLFSYTSFYLLIQSIFRIKKNGFIFRILRKIAL